MRIPNGTLILVADGRKLLLLRNDGDADYPLIVELEKREDENPADRDHKSDAPGRTRSASAGRTSAYPECDLHEQQEARFARETVGLLNRRAAAIRPKAIIVAADPHTLGAIRRHYSAAVRSALLGEVAKDLVRHPVARIERILAAE